MTFTGSFPLNFDLFLRWLLLLFVVASLDGNTNNIFLATAYQIIITTSQLHNNYTPTTGITTQYQHSNNTTTKTQDLQEQQQK